MPSPLHDLVVDKIEYGIDKRPGHDEHGEVVSDAAGAGDPCREKEQAREEREPEQVEEAWTRYVAPPLRAIGVLRHAVQLTTGGASRPVLPD